MSTNVANNTDELDPQIQIELENLNNATDEINKLEIELEEANSTFRLLLNESTRRLKLASKKFGRSIEKARPYHEALEKAREAQIECQKAADKFKRANEIHKAAKETFAVAEKRFMSNSHEWQFDNAWQEMLNHATEKVFEAGKQKDECHAAHQRLTQIFHEAEQRMQYYETRFRSSIQKSRPYFEEKQICQDQLGTQKNRIQELQQQVQNAKAAYSNALRNLERISNDIHRKRGDCAPLSGTPPPPPGPREPGVGAELNTPTTPTLPALPDYELELGKCDYPSIAGSQLSLGCASEQSLPVVINTSDTILNSTQTTPQQIRNDKEQSDTRSIVNEDDLEELKKKMKKLAVRPIEGGDGQQQQVDIWESELNATVNKLDHLMMLRERAKQQQNKLNLRPDSLGAEATKTHADPLPSIAITNEAGVVCKSATVNDVVSLPATPKHATVLHSVKTLAKLTPPPSVNVSMRELPLLARLSHELKGHSNVLLGLGASCSTSNGGDINLQQRRRSLN